jgi:hypothetical protein
MEVRIEDEPLFRNLYVSVRDENATYQVDIAGHPICVSRTRKNIINYSPSAYGLYRDNEVLDPANHKLYIFDHDYHYFTVNLTPGGN